MYTPTTGIVKGKRRPLITEKHPKMVRFPLYGSRQMVS
jgi:hypothetical protein